MVTLVGPSALEFKGLISWYSDFYALTTSHSELDGILAYNSWLYYIPSIDADDTGIRATVKTPFSAARVPTAERALLDCIEYIDRFDEEHLCVGLSEYDRIHKGNLTTLYAYAVDRGLLKQLKYWLKEV